MNYISKSHGFRFAERGRHNSPLFTLVSKSIFHTTHTSRLTLQRLIFDLTPFGLLHITTLVKT